MVCFCGCGREVKGLRAKAANAFGEQIQPMVVVFEGAVSAGGLGDTTDAVRTLSAEGRSHAETLAGVVHGAGDRRDLDKRALQDWSSRATSMSTRLGSLALDQGWNGRSTDLARLVHTGVHASGSVVAVRDTGTTVNTEFRVRVTIEFASPDGLTRTVTTKVSVSRLAPPRVGDAVELAYDPDDPDDIAFKLLRMGSESAPPDADDRLNRLQQLGELRDSGVLTAEEFEREKRRILDGA